MTSAGRPPSWPDFDCQVVGEFILQPSSDSASLVSLHQRRSAGDYGHQRQVPDLPSIRGLMADCRGSPSTVRPAGRHPLVAISAAPSLGGRDFPKRLSRTRRGVHEQNTLASARGRDLGVGCGGVPGYGGSGLGKHCGRGARRDGVSSPLGRRPAFLDEGVDAFDVGVAWPLSQAGHQWQLQWACGRRRDLGGAGHGPTVPSATAFCGVTGRAEVRTARLACPPRCQNCLRGAADRRMSFSRLPSLTCGFHEYGATGIAERSRIYDQLHLLFDSHC